MILRADNSARTQESAMALFEGLYPNMSNGDSNCNANYINLQTQDEETEIIIPNANNCPMYATNYEKALTSPNVIEV